MYQFFERGIRGGQSVVFKKYAKANNKYLSEYNPDEKSTYISYLLLIIFIEILCVVNYLMEILNG